MVAGTLLTQANPALRGICRGLVPTGRTQPPGAGVAGAMAPSRGSVGVRHRGSIAPGELLKPHFPILTCSGATIPSAHFVV